MRQLALVILLIAASFADAQSPTTTPATKYARQLAEECDELIRIAVKRPYGWGWSEEPVEAAGQRKTAQAVSLEPLASPTAGLLLLQASKLLDQPRFADAARHAARGVAATQLPSGKVPVQATFAQTVQTKEALSALPDRASTRAGLALLLAVLEQQEPRDEQLHRAAKRAAQWLFKQQAETGAWPILDPPEGPASKQSRIMRLDTPDARNDIFAILLAYEVLGDPLHRRATEKSIEFLDRIRNADTLPNGPGMWTTAYSVQGVPINDNRFPLVLDAMATRHAMQSTLALYMVLGGGHNLIHVQRAAKTLNNLPHDSNRWSARYTTRGEPIGEALNRPTTNPFGPAPAETPIPEDPGIARSLKIIEKIGELRREKAIAQFKPFFTPQQVLAHSIAGLAEGDYPMDLPADGQQLADYLAAHAQLFKALASPPSVELRSRVMRIWALYVRAVFERQLNA